MLKIFLTFLFVLVFTGCSIKGEVTLNDNTIKIGTSDKSVAKPLLIIDKPAKVGFETNASRYVDTIVVHTAYNVEFAGDPYGIDEVMAVFEKYKVSPHYIIDRKGLVYRTVDESLVAKHAGKSKMADGREGANLFSIGVELINSKTDYPTDAQYVALSALINDIKSRFAIQYIVGHKEIAPERKSDPWNFDFGRLHALLKDTTEDKNERTISQANIRNEQKRP